jgi:hypothetical protein
LKGADDFEGGEDGEWGGGVEGAAKGDGGERGTLRGDGQEDIAKLVDLWGEVEGAAEIGAEDGGGWGEGGTDCRREADGGECG